MGVVFGVMTLESAAFVGVCYAPCSTPQINTSTFLPCYHSALLPVLDVFLLIFALGEV